MNSGAGRTESTEVRSALIVDDDPDIRAIAELSLSLVGGWEVATASCGDEGVRMAVEFKPDLILLDVMMPGRDGIETLAALRDDARSWDIPVLFMTAKILPGEVGTYLEAGAHGVIAKPFDPISLPTTIREALSTGGIIVSPRPGHG